MAFLLCGGAQADGLSDLKASLARLPGQTALKAVVEVKNNRRLGDGKELEDSAGQASLTLEDGSRGLQVFYPKELMARAETEQWARNKDKKAKTPVLNGLKALELAELRLMTSAASSLARSVEEGVFKGETADSYQGKPARRLTFEVPLEKLPERDRKYIKDFDTVLTVWIASDGTPLASNYRSKLSGRAFVVISFEQNSEEERSYAVVGDRLVVLRKDLKGSGAGAGEKHEYKTSYTLQPQS